MKYSSTGKNRLLRQALVDTHGNVCFYCEEELQPNFTVDHFIPKALIGSDEMFNLRPSCLRCNTEKNSYECGEWAKRIDAKLADVEEKIKRHKRISKRIKKLQKLHEEAK